MAGDEDMAAFLAIPTAIKFMKTIYYTILRIVGKILNMHLKN